MTTPVPDAMRQIASKFWQPGIMYRNEVGFRDDPKHERYFFAIAVGTHFVFGVNFMVTYETSIFKRFRKTQKVKIGVSEAMLHISDHGFYSAGHSPSILSRYPNTTYDYRLPTNAIDLYLNSSPEWIVGETYEHDDDPLERFVVLAVGEEMVFVRYEGVDGESSVFKHTDQPYQRYVEKIIEETI